MAVWEQISAQGYRPTAWQVKRLLTEERVPGAAAVARFVGVEAYEAAGGQVLRDLFARDDESGVWFEDPVLLEKLATGKLQAAADELATRWKWAVAMIEVEWGDTARYGRIEPQPAERTPEEQAEIEKLETRQAELAEFDDEDWTQETLTEAESSRGFPLNGARRWFQRPATSITSPVAFANTRRTSTVPESGTAHSCGPRWRCVK